MLPLSIKEIVTPRLSKPRVLIVDDYAPNRVAAEMVLDTDCAVSHAGSGREALALCEREDFAVILLDARMPLLDGYATASELRRRERTRTTPIVFTSAVDRATSDVLHGFDAGGTDFLPSPWDADLLRAKVNTYAKMHLCDMALKTQVTRLADIVRALRKEVARKADLSSPLYEQVQSLERTLRALGPG
jgi:PleD family two-component response regulator